MGPEKMTLWFVGSIAITFPTVITMLPEAAPIGTGTTISVSLQLVGAAGVPLRVTVLASFVAPKFTPMIFTRSPAAAAGGEREEITGTIPTKKTRPLLVASPTVVTTTLPEAALFGTGTTISASLQLAGKAALPLNVTAPFVAPKF